MGQGRVRETKELIRASRVFSRRRLVQLHLHGTGVPNSTGQLAPVAGTGSSFADFLLGMPKNGSVTSMPRTHFRWTELVPYVQDTWRVRPTVTLNLGLGWNMSTPPNAVGSDSLYPYAFDFQPGQVKFAALGQISPEVCSIDLNDFAPRVGIAWQPLLW